MQTRENQMHQHQRANTFLKEHESLFDGQVLPTELLEALDLSKIRGRYAGLPPNLKVPATLGHILVVAGLIMEELEKLRADFEKIKTNNNADRTVSSKGWFHRRV